MEGLKVLRWAKFRTVEQEVHIRLHRVDDSAQQEEIRYYPKSYAVNATVTRNEGYRSYPRRSVRNAPDKREQKIPTGVTHIARCD